jgi:hypothetical protein
MNAYWHQLWHNLHNCGVVNDCREISTVNKEISQVVKLARETGERVDGMREETEKLEVRLLTA